jgi:hypothetical protein
MKINTSGYITLILFIALAAIGFSLWVGGLLLIWLLLRSVGIATDLWAMMEAMSTAVAAAAVLSAGFVAYRELSEAASSRHMEVADRLFKELDSPENVAARRWVYQNLRENPAEGIVALTEAGQAAIKQVLNSLDHVAFLTQAGWIPDEIIMPWMHPMIAKSWEKLEPYVKFERQRRNEPYYYQSIDDLARRCRIWRGKNLIHANNLWIEDAL